MDMIYLDHAAATPLDPRVLAAMQPYFSERFYNPSAMYSAAQGVYRDIEAARSVVALCLGVRPAEVVFTAGGTEANNLAISGVMRRYPQARMLLSAIEHDSVLETAKQYEHSILPVSEQGIVQAEAVQARIDDQTVLVTIMYANNEVGTIQPIREISGIINQVRNDRRARGVDLPLYFHTDAAQATNYLDMQVSRLGVDLMTLNGGKMYGPKQSGALYIRAGVTLLPLITGGGQEHKIRSGTENVPGIIGCAAALQIAQGMRNEETKRLAELQRYFYHQLKEYLPTAIINGSLKRRLPNNLHITIPGKDNERLLYQLDDAGIMAAAGSACSASNEAASHVLLAMGLSEADARSSLRLTMGRATDKAALERTLQALSDFAR
ncbi:MAG TPA: cysteine desulfurase family protein [Candidatus Saccharimonadales bacterium]|jgi:cysteine desulfurase